MTGPHRRRPPRPMASAAADHPASWPRVAVIVVNWNGWRHSIECLESLRRMTYPAFEIIVVDNGSSDGSVARIKAWARGDAAVDSPYLEVRAAGQSIALEEYDVSGVSDPLAERSPRRISPQKDLPAEGSPRRKIGEQAGSRPSARGRPPARPLSGPRVLLLKGDTNAGFTGGNNVGIRWGLERGAEFVFLINNDAIAEPDVLTKLVREALPTPQVGMVAPTVLRYADPSLVDRQGIALTKGGLPYERRSADVGPLFCPDGCAALYRRSMLLAVARDGQYFDEEFVAYIEDVDLGIRARRRGFSAALVEPAIVYHKGGASQGGPRSPRSIYLRHRNTIWLLAKDFPPKVLLRNALWILAAQIGTLAWNLATPARAAVLKGKLDGILGLRRMWRKRREDDPAGDRADLPLDRRVFLPGRRAHPWSFRAARAGRDPTVMTSRSG